MIPSSLGSLIAALAAYYNRSLRGFRVRKKRDLIGSKKLNANWHAKILGISVSR